jgi:hypothetical protein
MSRSINDELASEVAKLQTTTDERHSRYESEFLRINSSIGDLENKVDRGFHDITKAIQNIGQSNRITWPLIFTAIATIVMVCGVVASLLNAYLQPIRLELNHTKYNLEELAKDESVQRDHMVLENGLLLENKVQPILYRVEKLEEGMEAISSLRLEQFKQQ